MLRTLVVAKRGCSDVVGHGHVVLVQGQLPAIDPRAEGEVAGHDGEHAGDGAGSDGCDVGSCVSARAGSAAWVGLGRLRHDGTALRHREQGRCAGRDGPLSRGLDGRRQGGATGLVAADDGPNRLGHAVAVAAAQTDVAVVAG